MAKAVLKPVVSNLRELLLKGLADKMDKLGFSEEGVWITDRPLSTAERQTRDEIQTLFLEREAEGTANDYDFFIEECARTWMHILIFFKTMEKRGMSQGLTAELLQQDTDFTDTRLLPDFSHSSPQLFLEFIKMKEDDIACAEAMDGYGEEKIYYALKLYLDELCEKLGREIPILFGSRRLLFPDFKAVKKILTVLNQITEDEFLQDDFQGWVYQYWLDTTPSEMASAHAERNESYACRLYARILDKLSREQAEAGEYYTPHWVVRFIVEQSLNICLEKKRPIETVRLIDPACGAGNFLVYAFEMFYRYYQKEHPDWADARVIQSILEQNIYGCEIKRESLQIAAVSLWLKVRQKAADAGILDFHVQKMNLLLANSLVRWEREACDVKPGQNISLFDEPKQPADTKSWFGEVCDKSVARSFFQKKFQIVVMNPPFVDARKMNRATSEFLKAEYGENSRNLFGAFIERVFELTEKESVIGFISSETFFYLNSFIMLRNYIMKHATIRMLLSLGRGVFEGPAVDAAISIYEVGRKYRVELLGANLSNIHMDVSGGGNVIAEALSKSVIYRMEQSQFRIIQSYPFLYDLSPKMCEILSGYPPLGMAGRHYARIKQGMATGDNEKYLYQKWEIPEELLGTRFFPYAKGGGYSKYCNDITEYIDWREEAQAYYSHSKRARRNYLGSYFSKGDTSLFLKEAITYSDITSNNRFSARLLPEGCIFDVKGSCLFPHGIDSEYLLGFINSKFVNYVLKKLNPSPSFQVGDLARIPFQEPDGETLAKVKNRVQKLLELQQFLLGFSDTSDYYHHTEIAYGLQRGAVTLEEAYGIYQKSWNRTQKRKYVLQKEIDRLIYRLYGLAKQDIRVIEGELPDIQPEKERAKTKKEAVLSYLRTMVKERLVENKPSLYRDQEIEVILRECFFSEFGFILGDQLWKETETLLERTVLHSIRGGILLDSATIPFAGEEGKDAGEPVLRQKVLFGTGRRKAVIFWHAGQFKFRLDENAGLTMQNEIERLLREYYLPELRKIEDGLAEEKKPSCQKCLLEKKRILEACVQALKAWQEGLFRN